MSTRFVAEPSGQGNPDPANAPSTMPLTLTGKIIFIDPAIPEGQKTKLRERIVALGGGVAPRYDKTKVTHVICAPIDSAPLSPLAPKVRAQSRTRQLTSLMNKQAASITSIRNEARGDDMPIWELRAFDSYFNKQATAARRPVAEEPERPIKRKKEEPSPRVRPQLPDLTTMARSHSFLANSSGSFRAAVAPPAPATNTPRSARLMTQGMIAAFRHPFILVEDLRSDVLKPFWKEFKPDQAGNPSLPQIYNHPHFVSPFIAAPPKAPVRPPAPPTALPPRLQRRLSGSQAPKEEADFKEGWCECCKVRFGVYLEHVTSFRHVKYATTDSNYAAIDAILSSLEANSLAASSAAVTT